MGNAILNEGSEGLKISPLIASRGDRTGGRQNILADPSPSKMSADMFEVVMPVLLGKTRKTESNIVNQFVERRHPSILPAEANKRNSGSKFRQSDDEITGTVKKWF